MPEESLTITDNRTGTSYTLPLSYGAVDATLLERIHGLDADHGVLSLDPALENTAVARSNVTYIDGDRGILRYRGYDIQDVAAHGDFLEIAYLVLYGELPSAGQLEAWTDDIKHHTMVHENVKQFIEGFRHDAHPMAMLISSLAALATFYPDSRDVTNSTVRDLQIRRSIAKVPTLAAYAYRHSQGLFYVYPDNDLSFAANFLTMLWKRVEPRYTPNPVLERALNTLFILHMDHEQNCGTYAMRVAGSSLADPYSCLAAASAALSGPLHGGANEAVLRMLTSIGSKARVPEFVRSVIEGHGRLMGFGHRVYKNYDPRARIIKELADEVFAVTGTNPLLEIALELERIALSDEYFVSRKLYPNVDFYSGLIYQSMGFPIDMFPVLFAIPRTVGWLAHWNEMLSDPHHRIVRPRQVYEGVGERSFVPLERRG